ncbi:hypothetical protein JCM8097_007640 [Rhodosporidiobolus ruineniae]
MPIGPQLPPHFAAPQRSAEDDAAPPAPSSSSTAAAPPPPAHDTTGNDSDSDDYGPSLPPDLEPHHTAAPVAGPSKPSIGPSLPPHLAARQRSPSPGPAPALGPSRPPAAYRPAEDSDDDDFGPMPLPAGVQFEDNDGARQFREREERQAEKERKEREGAGKPKREEWMLVPPKEMDLLSSMDTTKLKSRGFATGKAAASAGKKEGPSTLWTETPAERQQRLQDEMLGKKRKAENAPKEEESDEARRKRKRDQQLKDEVERHNRANRHESLVDSHTKSTSKAKKEDDDRAPTAIWDRDRDLGHGGRVMDDGKRASIIKNAKGLGGRFSGGGYM